MRWELLSRIFIANAIAFALAFLTASMGVARACEPVVLWL
jgi:hypothetical protein